MPTPLHPQIKKVIMALQAAFPEPLSREALCDVLWKDGAKPASVADALKSCITRARSALREAGCGITICALPLGDGATVYTLVSRDASMAEADDIDACNRDIAKVDAYIRGDAPSVVAREGFGCVTARQVRSHYTQVGEKAATFSRRVPALMRGGPSHVSNMQGTAQ